MAAHPLCRVGCADSPACERTWSTMTLMLLAMFAAAALGIFAKEFGRRESALSVGIAVALTGLYFLRPWYMT